MPEFRGLFAQSKLGTKRTPQQSTKTTKDIIRSAVFSHCVAYGQQVYCDDRGVQCLFLCGEVGDVERPSVF